MYDLLIKNARIADGLGATLVHGDVAVQNGRIAAVGALNAAAHERVDADGLVLAPGIIDLHTHYDAQLTWDRTASPSPALGVTTVVIGNCGFGIAPAPPAQRSLIARNLSEVEGMSLHALENGIDWDFTSFADYLNLLRRKGCFPNVAAFVGHSTVRSAVLGPQASERAATAPEIAAMKTLVRQALDAGAIGFASSQSQNHTGYGGVPMPSRLATAEELHALVGTLGEAGKGVFQITIGPTNSIDFLAELAAASRRPIIFSALFYNDALPKRAPSMLAQCLEAQEQGLKIYAQVACQPLAMEFTLANAYPMQSLDAWAPLRSAAPEQLTKAYADPAFRAAVRAQLSQPAPGKLFYGNWQHVDIAEIKTDANRGLEGLNVAAAAQRRQTDPLELFFDLGLAENLATLFSAKLLNVNEDRVEELLRHPASLISLSDAGAHVSYLCDAGFGLRLYSHWVRERGTFTLEEAIRQITSVPAQVYGIPERGCIQVGNWADLMLFDPATVGVSELKRVQDLPGGESRLIREGYGVQGVWVNGVQVWDGADYCQPGTAPGQILNRRSPDGV